MSTYKEFLNCFKIIILGSGGVGKTCLFNRYCFNYFNGNSELTIGVNFHSTKLTIQTPQNGNSKENEKYIINSIFDFGGQERFKQLVPRLVSGTDGALLVFDSVSYSSFIDLDYWYEVLIKNIKNPIPILLVGTKNDLLNKSPSLEIVKDEEIQEFVSKRNIDGFFRTSALKNYNVIKVFMELNKLILETKNIEAHIL